MSIKELVRSSLVNATIIPKRHDTACSKLNDDQGAETAIFFTANFAKSSEQI